MLLRCWPMRRTMSCSEVENCRAVAPFSVLIWGEVAWLASSLYWTWGLQPLACIVASDEVRDFFRGGGSQPPSPDSPLASRLLGGLRRGEVSSSEMEKLKELSLRMFHEKKNFTHFQNTTKHLIGQPQVSSWGHGEGGGRNPVLRLVEKDGNRREGRERVRFTITGTQMGNQLTRV